MAIQDFIFRSVTLPVICAALLTPQQQPIPAAPQLSPTVHPAIPTNPSDLWLVPSESDRSARMVQF